jgi:hypothetical protein
LLGNPGVDETLGESDSEGLNHGVAQIAHHEGDIEPRLCMGDHLIDKRVSHGDSASELCEGLVELLGVGAAIVPFDLDLHEGRPLPLMVWEIR